MVKTVRVENGRVSATIELTTPAVRPAQRKIQSDAEAALKRVPGVTGLDITWGAQVRGQPQGSGMLPGVKNIILVGAGKGGVGKSTVSVNLAVALARHGATVGLLDADFYGPSIPMMTGLSEQRPVSPDGKRLEPLETLGLKIMSLGFLVEPDQALIWRGPMLHGALQQLLRDVNWGALDLPGDGPAARHRGRGAHRLPRASGPPARCWSPRPRTLPWPTWCGPSRCSTRCTSGAGHRGEHEPVRLSALPHLHTHLSPRWRAAGGRALPGSLSSGRFPWCCRSASVATRASRWSPPRRTAPRRRRSWPWPGRWPDGCQWRAPGRRARPSPRRANTRDHLCRPDDRAGIAG